MKKRLFLLPALIASITTVADVPQVLFIPGGSFVMGDHHNLGGGEHRNDELPLRTVTLSPFWMGNYEITAAQYCDFLNHADVAVRNGLIYQGNALLCDTRDSSKYSRIQFDGKRFSVLDGRENHPAINIRWKGAAAYCNWLSAQQKLEPCYAKDWTCDATKNGYRLPTETEREYAARGGLYHPYAVFPWGDNTDPARANWPDSGDPYEAGTEPFTTPVTFYDGSLQQKADFHWPSPQPSYQTKNGINGFGLYDMAGNIWEWCNDLYSNSTAEPDNGKPMPDGKIYHTLRGGSWYNGEWGHSRVSNRDPGYFRGPLDPNHPYYHIGLRVVRNAASVPLVAGDLKVLGDSFKFTEGPAADQQGNVYFSDVQAQRTYVLSTDGTLRVFRENTGGANGLYFDRDENLVACEMNTGRITSIAPDGKVSVVTEAYGGKGFNQPNDLWIDPQGGIYFTDPIYGKAKQKQDGQHVYYLRPDRASVIRVIDDFVRPNGLIGTPDGKTLYVADAGSTKIWSYAIQPDGTLSGKTRFAKVACDGMTLDAAGNLYVAENAILIFSPAGQLLNTIKTPVRPTNATFGGKDHRTLYITARTCFCAVPMNIPGTVHTFAEDWKNPPQQNQPSAAHRKRGPGGRRQPPGPRKDRQPKEERP